MSPNSAPLSQPAMDLERARFNMIEQQIRPWDVANSAVLTAMNTLPRENFVPEAYRNLAFADMEIPLSQPDVEGECMLAPKVQARMLQDAAVQPTDAVLHIGTGSGYTAALLGKQAKTVLSIEINARLAALARSNLNRAGITNVDVLHADAAASAFKACEAMAPYDVILLSGSVAEVPRDLLQLLKVGGRLVALVGDEPVMRATLVTRTSDTGYSTEQPWDHITPRLLHFPQPSTFRF